MSGRTSLARIPTIRSPFQIQRWLSLVFGLVLAVPSISRAAMLISWDVDGVELNTAGWSAPYIFNGTPTEGVSGGSLTLGPGVTPSTTVHQYGFKVAAVNTQTNLEGAIQQGHYLQFTITAATGYVLNLESIFVRGSSSATGANDIALLSSIGGFSGEQVIESVTSVQGVTGGFDSDESGFGAGSILLSGPQYQNLSSVTFRLYGWNTSSGAGVSYIRNLSGVDLAVHGTAVVVPEPGRMVLVTFGTVGMIILTSRKRKSVWI